MATDRVTHRTHPHERGYTRLSLKTWMNVSPVLRERLLRMELDVYFELADDMADAFRRASQADREQCKVERDRLARRWHRKRRASAGAQLRRNREYLLRSGPPCRYCTALATQVDHLVPRNQGGSNRRGNLAPVCGPCNREKAGRTVTQWQDWCKQVGLAWPPDHGPHRLGFKQGRQAYPGA